MYEKPTTKSLIQTQLLAARALLLISSLVTALSAFGQVSGNNTNSVQPTIHLTNVPPPGGGEDQMETISGEVSGVNPAELKVVIFSLAGGVWYVQPYTNAPHTDIDASNRFVTEVHLGAHYGALLVRPSYQPPDTTGALPTVGGDVLAVTEAAAGSRSETAEGAIAATFSWLFQWWRLFAGALVILSLIALTKQAESFVSAVETFLSKVFEGGDKLFGSSLMTVVNWLKKVSEKTTGDQTDDAQTNDNPLFMLLGLVCLVIACASAYANYFILNQSLVIFWPISETTWILAGSLIALQGLVGICLHLRLFRDKKWMLWGLLALLAIEFLVSYGRVIETEKVRLLEQTATEVSRDAGSLTINAPSLGAQSPQITPSGASQPAAPQTPSNSPGGYFSWYALWSGLITVICGLSETLGIYAGVHCAGVALVWLTASPALGVLAVAFCAFRFLNRSRIAGVAKIILAALIDTLSKLGSLVVICLKAALQAARKIVEWLRRLPAKLVDSYRAWRKARLSHREEMKKLRESLKRERESELKLLEIALASKEEDARRRSVYLNSEAEAHWQQHITLTGIWRGVVVEVFDDLRTTLRDSFRQVGRKFSADFVEITAEKTRESVDPAAEQVSSDMAEVYVKTGHALPTVNGYQANRQQLFRDESKVAAKKLEV